MEFVNTDKVLHVVELFVQRGVTLGKITSAFDPVTGNRALTETRILFALSGFDLLLVSLCDLVNTTVVTLSEHIIGQSLRMFVRIVMQVQTIQPVLIIFRQPLRVRGKCQLCGGTTQVEDPIVGSAWVLVVEHSLLVVDADPRVQPFQFAVNDVHMRLAVWQKIKFNIDAGTVGVLDPQTGFFFETVELYDPSCILTYTPHANGYSGPLEILLFNPGFYCAHVYYELSSDGNYSIHHNPGEHKIVSYHGPHNRTTETDKQFFQTVAGEYLPKINNFVLYTGVSSV
ncbi:hypothetical protein WICPIJ_000430 [Wickerhamomyces pijperi]|uniref:Uncharacterized protein n=1 Tax=Wickerhamomyces pijperi TaxID=599730 RepID=A0A9P8QDS6_WICPI|nr:hypothetical protein WICPIJ_000430 [Wickerhamomyces pijperi]